MILPKRQQTFQQIGTPQKRAILRRGRPRDNMIAPAGAHAPAIQQKFIGSQAGLSGRFINPFRDGF